MKEELREWREEVPCKQRHAEKSAEADTRHMFHPELIAYSVRAFGLVDSLFNIEAFNIEYPEA